MYGKYIIMMNNIYKL